ncbi:MAG TPA: LytTR family DNA-binding domain-containing protein [Longimicrobiales bacterium]|nr:LytTR family DNA-binding domain-containing protein [Longimicrobiales bacterium]
MNPYRVLIVDDEPLARRRIRQLIAAAPDFDVVGDVGEAREVAALVAELRPDVLFLDIHMPHADGFEIRDALRSSVQHVVFITAHPEHAARAFDVAATDYLVKPVTQARFDDALQRIRRATAAPAGERVLLGGRLGGRAVPVADIVWLEAQGAYVTAHVGAATHVMRESLSALIERLGPRFVRVHRSAAVNLGHVVAVRRMRGRLTVELAGGSRIPVSRRMAAEVVDLLRRAS